MVKYLGKILKGGLDSIPSSSPWVKIQIMVGKFCLRCKSKTLHCWELSMKFWKQNVCWHQPAKFCLVTSSKLSAINLNFHWRWRWWDRIQAIFFNLFYFTDLEDAFGQICVKTLKHSVFVLILEKNKIKHHQLLFWQKLDPGILTKGTWTLKKSLKLSAQT